MDGADGVDGTDGTDGTNGVDGSSSFIHIKYSDNNGGSFTGNNGDDVGDWLGIFISNTATPSLSIGDYEWIRFRAVDGVDGTNGAKGNDGVDGVDGVDGIPGVNGNNNFFHIKYSNDNGLTMTANNGASAGAYVGTLVDNNLIASLDVFDYTWSQVLGNDGTNGTDGIDGAPGYIGVDGTNGTDGSDGINGLPGTRGTISTFASYATPPTDGELTATIYFLVDPDVLVDGDNIIYTVDGPGGGTKSARYDNGSWVKNVQLYVDGDAVITGTLSADRIVANSISVSSVMTVLGDISKELVYPDVLTNVNGGAPIASFTYTNFSSLAESISVVGSGRSGVLSTENIDDDSQIFAIYRGNVPVFGYGWTPLGQDAKSANFIDTLPPLSSATYDIYGARTGPAGVTDHTLTLYFNITGLRR